MKKGDVVTTARDLLLTSALFAMIVVGFTGCNIRSSEAKPQAESAKPETKTAGDGAADTKAEVSNGESATTKAEKKYSKQDPTMGAIIGRIVLKGDPPKIAPTVADPANRDHAKCAKHVTTEDLILSKGREIKNVVVSIDGYKPKGRPKPRDLVLDNKHCTFVPHVSAATVGSRLKVTNSDNFLHNTHALLSAEFNLVVPKGGNIQKRLRRPGWVLVICDIHPWMKSHIQVFAHDFFDVTTAEGVFRIHNIPPGEYDLRVWHERLAILKGKVVQKSIKVEAGKTIELELSLEAPKVK